MSRINAELCISNFLFLKVFSSLFSAGSGNVDPILDVRKSAKKNAKNESFFLKFEILDLFFL